MNNKKVRLNAINALFGEKRTRGGSRTHIGRTGI